MHRTTRTPACLYKQARQQADQDYARRTAELLQLQPLLERLKPVLPALEAAGLTIYPQDIALARHYPNGRQGKTLRALRIRTRLLTVSTDTTQRWIDVLLAQGFKQVHLDSCVYYPHATLQRGHLILVVDAPANAAAAAAVAKAQQQRRAEDAFAGAEA